MRRLSAGVGPILGDGNIRLNGGGRERRRLRLEDIMGRQSSTRGGNGTSRVGADVGRRGGPVRRVINIVYGEAKGRASLGLNTGLSLGSDDSGISDRRASGSLVVVGGGGSSGRFTIAFEISADGRK